MKDQSKTKQVLIQELVSLRQRIADLERTESGRIRAESQRLVSLETLGKRESLIRAITDSARDAILMMDPTGCISFWNPAAEHIFGYTSEEAIGQDLHQFLAPKRYREAYYAAFSKFKKTGQGEVLDKTIELQACRKNGGELPIELSLSAIHSEAGWHALGIIRDITERKEVNRKLQEAVIFQQRLIDALPVPVFFKDSEGRYLGCNSSFEIFFGQKKEQVTGKAVYELTPKEFADIYHEKDLALLQNPGVQIYESTVKDAGGVVHNVIFHKATFLNMDGSVGGLIGGFLDVTERKRAEEALRNSEVRLRTLVHTIPDLIWLKDKDGVYLSCNTMFERFFGAKEAEIVGKTDYDFVDRELANSFREHDLKAMAAGKTTSNEEWIAFAGSGHRVFLETIKTPMHDSQGTLIGVLGIGRDITDRKGVEEALQKSEESKRLLLHAVGDGMFGVDATGQLTFVNPAASRILGFSVEEMFGQRIHGLIHHSHADGSIYPAEDCPMYASYSKATESHITDEVLWRKDGSSFPVEYTSMPIIKDGKVMGAVVTFRDITERKEIELGLKNAHEKLEALAIDLERAARVKSEFLASMSHELRTPLNAVIGFSQVLQDQDFGPLNEKQKEYVLDIVESGKHLLNLINDILDLSKVEAGKMELQFSPVVVGDLLAGSLVMIKEKAMKHGITLKTDIPEELSHFEMLADERKFKQILFNLLSNASKFTPNNGAITLSARRMAEGEGEVIQVSVKDTGIGITPENQGKVFESFYQISGSLTSKTSGTGLGLPLARSFVKLHGGRMWVESEGDGKGSQFYFTLPVQPVLPEIGKHDILLDHLKRFISFSKRHDKTFALCFLYMKGENLQLKIHEIDEVMEKNKRAYDFSMFEEEGIITLLLQDIDQDSARMICERIVTDIKSKFETFETSFSLVSYPSDGDNPEKLVERVKAATRYQTSFHSEQMKGK